MKKTFKDLERIIIMREWGDSISLMSNEQKGILLQTIFDFADCKDIDVEDPMVNVVWKMIEPNMDRINRNYLTRVNNGKKGGAPVGNTNNRKKPNSNPKKPNNNPLGSTNSQPKVNLSQPKVNPSQPKVNHSQVEVNRKSTDRDRDRDRDRDKEGIEIGIGTEITGTGNYSIAADETLTPSGKVVTKNENRRIEEFEVSDLTKSLINNLEITEHETV